MMETPDRRNPVKDTILTLLFPGFYLWKRDEKIQAFSISVAAYVGYFIGIGFLVLFYMLFSNWKKTLAQNRQYGFEEITDNEQRWVTLSGIAGGISAHPLYLIIVYHWLLSIDLIIPTQGNAIQINPVGFLLALTIIFGLRFLLFYSLRKTVGGEKNADMRLEMERFAGNNACLVILAPLFSIMILPLTQSMVDQLTAFIIVPLVTIFGSRVAYNNFTSIR